ncbi:MAG: OmpA family protein [Lewinellaceae bacterium]|nr:OmpA family protein [Saprospiraceae bacterium]MCB9337727.1 OmpA family protein [Lewinellaceae bacterium]
MRFFIIGFLLFTAFALPARWYFVCEIRHHCTDEPAKPTRATTLTLKDGDKTILQGYEQFGFAPNSFQPDMTPNNQEFLEKVAAYLQQNPDKHLALTGRFLATEKDAKTGIFENLGIARAAAVERLLEKLGIDEKRISIDHEMAKGETLEEPVTFSLYTPKPDEYEKLEYKFTDNTFSDANFDFGSDKFRPGEQCILYADSVKTFLDTHPEMTLTIIGHTDSIGTDKVNMDLGLRRAINAAEYFRELGVKSKIDVSSKGETQPVAPNSLPDGKDNPDGRQKNRRVNFKIGEKQVE